MAVKAKFSPRYAHLRRLIIESRKKANLNQAELAQRLGKPQSFVSKIEAGERRLDVVEFIELIAAIGDDPLRLLRKLLPP